MRAKEDLFPRNQNSEEKKRGPSIRQDIFLIEGFFLPAVCFFGCIGAAHFEMSIKMRGRSKVPWIEFYRKKGIHMDSMDRFASLEHGGSVG